MAYGSRVSYVKSLLYVWYSTTILIGHWTAQVTSMRGTCGQTCKHMCPVPHPVHTIFAQYLQQPTCELNGRQCQSCRSRALSWGDVSNAIAWADPGFLGVNLQYLFPGARAVFHKRSRCGSTISNFSPVDSVDSANASLKDNFEAVTVRVDHLWNIFGLLWEHGVCFYVSPLSQTTLISPFWLHRRRQIVSFKTAHFEASGSFLAITRCWCL